MNNHITLNNILVRLFADILYIEEKCLQKTKFSDLSISEYHVIDNIGIDGEKTMSDTAKALKVTSGTLTTAINNLIKKGYVERRRSDKDRRVVKIKLSPTGIEAYNVHADFHNDLVVSALERLDKEEEEVLLKALSNIDSFFKVKYNF